MMQVVVGKKQRPKNAEEVKWEHMSVEELGSLAVTDGLFSAGGGSALGGGGFTYVFVGALNGEKGDEFLKFAKEFVDSDHTFIFEEEKLLKRETDIVTKAGAKVEKIETVKKERGFDPYGLTFALGAKDKKKLWLGLMQAFREGEKAEAMAGLLAWKARQMKDTNLSRELLVLYHNAHRGMGEFELLLERFALKL